MNRKDIKNLPLEEKLRALYIAGRLCSSNDNTICDSSNNPLLCQICNRTVFTEKDHDFEQNFQNVFYAEALKLLKIEDIIF